MPGKKEIHKDLVVLTLVDYKSWLTWLAKNQEQTEGVWIKFAKKASGNKSISYEEAREGAIIYGWIDGLINSYTEQAYLRKFTQRRRRSKWSKINRKIAETLIKSNTMKPRGLAEVNAAKKDGRWKAAYSPQSTIKMPAKLAAFLKKNKKANAFFESLSSANRYAILYRIENSVRPETKQRHLEKAMTMLRNQDIPNPMQTKKK